MLVHTFDYVTGIYTGPLQLTAADVDPRSNAWLVPGNATLEPPPRCDINTMPVWREGRWIILECVADVPDELLMRCRYGVEQMMTLRAMGASNYSGPTEKVK